MLWDLHFDLTDVVKIQKLTANVYIDNNEVIWSFY